MVQPVRSLAHAPLFQVMFAWQNTPQGDAATAGAGRCRAVQSGERLTAKFDLTLTLAGGGRRIVGRLSYATALFERATIERYREALAATAGRDGGEEAQAVERLPLLTEAEREQMLVEWNAHAGGVSEEQCIHELFEEQVRSTPEAVAVVYEERALSYAS